MVGCICCKIIIKKHTPVIGGRVIETLSVMCKITAKPLS